MNISSIKWQGSRFAIFCFMHLQRRSFRGSLTPLYSDFKVVGEICRDLFRFLQCSHDPGCSYPQPLIIWSKMPRVGAQPLKGSPALCHVKTCSRKMGKPFLCIPSFWFPMPPNCHHTKGWLQPFNPPWSCWLSQHLPSFCIPWCQPWRFNGPFWNSVWLLVWFPSAATIKWLAWTFQPTMKLVIEPASAILLHSLMPALAFQWAILE